MKLLLLESIDGILKYSTNNDKNKQVYKKAIELADSFNLGIPYGRELFYYYSDDNEVIGALFISDNISDFSFDVVVDKDYQKEGIGGKLIEMALVEYKRLKGVYGSKYLLKVEVVNPTMLNILKNKYHLKIHETLSTPDNWIMTENSPKTKLIEKLEKLTGKKVILEDNVFKPRRLKEREEKLKKIFDEKITFINNKELTYNGDVDEYQFTLLKKYYENYLINIIGEVNIDIENDTSFGVSFGYIKGKFHIETTTFYTLIGFPNKVYGNVIIYCSTTELFNEKNIRKICQVSGDVICAREIYDMAYIKLENYCSINKIDYDDVEFQFIEDVRTDVESYYKLFEQSDSIINKYINKVLSE